MTHGSEVLAFAAPGFVELLRVFVLRNADVWEGSSREIEVALHVFADDVLFQLAVDVVPLDSVLEGDNKS